MVVGIEEVFVFNSDCGVPQCEENANTQHEGVSMKNFDLLKVLGTGAYGKVYMVRKNRGPDRGQLYAMKVLKKANIVQKKKTTEHTRTERQVLETIRQSPFLVTMHYAFQTQAKLHLVLDYVRGGELFTHLYQREKFKENEVRIYIGEIILALEHLHKYGIIYRDIKLENILLDGDGHIALTDFGLSREFQAHETEQRAYSFCGTIEYMAPEVVRGGNLGHDIAVDWWSVGVLTYELLTGASPFTVGGEKNTQQEISKRILKCEPPMPDTLSKDVTDFILRLLVKDPRQRMGGGPKDAEELKAHRFFRSINWDDLLRKNIPAPFVPRISGETDTSNFSEEFTSMLAVDSPGIVPPNVEKVFKGYSYVAPSVLFSENNVSDDIFKPSPDKRPSVSNLVGMRIKKSAFFERYSIDMHEKILGDGSFSVCRKCVNLQTKQEFAVKIISRRVNCTQEIQLLRLCQGHPGVVNLIEVFQDECHTYIVMEQLRGNELFQRIKKKRRFTEVEASRIMKKLVSTISYIHSLGVVHRDLKPENLLFTSMDDNADIKIVDFGFARFAPTDVDTRMLTPCFTLPYAAPEVLKMATRPGSQEGYSESCDIWSLGVILFAMLSGNAPFYSRSRTDPTASIMQRIREGDFRMDGDSWKQVSSGAKNLTKGLLTVDPRKRLAMDQLINSTWLAGTSSSFLTSHNLLTPSILAATPTAERRLKQTYNAFHNATREGFRLSPISSASSKLLQKRKNKQSISTETESSASGSDRSSYGSSKCSVTSLSQSSSKKWSEPIHSAGDLKSKKNNNSDMFNFKGAQMHQYLSSLGMQGLLPRTLPTTGHYDHPLMARPPITAPLTVQVASSHTYSSSHHTPLVATGFLNSPTTSSTLMPYQPLYPLSSGVSLSVIQTDLDVIRPSTSTVIPSLLLTSPAASSPSSHLSSPQTCPLSCTCGCSAGGPLTRSRKRRLQDCDIDPVNPVIQSPDPTKSTKNKCRRTGTITIE